MDEFYQQYLRNKIEFSNQFKKQMGKSCFRDAVKHYYHHSVGSIARSLASFLHVKPNEVLVLGITDKDYEINGASRYVPNAIVNIPRVKYTALRSGMKINGEIPLGELRPEDYTLKKIRGKSDKPGVDKIWPE